MWVAFLEKLPNLHGLAHPNSDRVKMCRSHLSESESELSLSPVVAAPDVLLS